MGFRSSILSLFLHFLHFLHFLFFSFLCYVFIYWLSCKDPNSFYEAASDLTPNVYFMKKGNTSRSHLKKHIWTYCTFSFSYILNNYLSPAGLQSMSEWAWECFSAVWAADPQRRRRYLHDPPRRPWAVQTPLPAYDLLWPREHPGLHCLTFALHLYQHRTYRPLSSQDGVSYYAVRILF